MSASILLLSGGASTRMGQDKGSLPYAEADLLSWQEQRFAQAGFHVVSRLPDVHTGYLGPLAGIHSALWHCPTVANWIVIPVDMPLLSIAAVRYLQAQGIHYQRPVSFENCPLPLFLPKTNQLTLTLDQWLGNEQGKRSVYALVNALNGLWVEHLDVQEELTNINTPSQWQHFIEGVSKV
ncbi:MAG: molybdenum cofactor guanylyltransferase [Reinekea sp.]|nr:molybdenum cofactor guanylyltransferase [Reinekea sp.]